MRILLWIVGILAALIALAFLTLGDPAVPRGLLVKKYGQAPSQYADLGGGMTAHYRDQGNARGPVLVLLHGSNASLHTWGPWVNRLGDRFRVVTVDLPGHGLTIVPEEYPLSAEGMADFVDAFSTKLALPRFVIGGNSMGGHVALRFAIKYPLRTAAVIPIDTGGIIPPNMPEPPAFFRIMSVPGLREVFRLFPGRPIAEATLKASFANQVLVTDAMIDRYWELNREPAIRAATRKRFRMGWDYWRGEDRFMRANLGQIKVPALVLWGAQDKLIPVEAAELVKGAIPGAQLIVYPDGGHILQEDLPEQSTADARTFLKAVFSLP
ncbi:MAG: alpha/beta hydrolase [Alphaproteobacteria bacterium]|nr:alpha/beta hydrolase [Alphaproteobacteria bacterium]